VCLVAVAAAADDSRDTAKDDGPSWFGRWFGGAKKKEPEKKPEKKKVAPDKNVVERPVQPNLENKPDIPIVDDGKAERARAEATYLRRMLVCDKLEEMTNDLELLRQIDGLRQRVRMTYSQRTAYLPAAGAHDLDEEIIGQHLGAAGRRPEAAAHTVHATESLEGTASREEKP
jgi:hypothetical protein